MGLAESTLVGNHGKNPAMRRPQMSVTRFHFDHQRAQEAAEETEAFSISGSRGREYRYVTTVYELLRKCDPTLVEQYLYPRCQGAKGDLSDKASAGRMRTFIAALREITPDLSQSALSPIDLTDTANLQRISVLSWPKALGTRICLGGSHGCKADEQYAAILLGHMINAI